MKISKLLLFFLLISISKISIAKDLNVKALEDHLNSIKTLEATFKQYASGSQSVGKLYISKPYKIKWEYTSPKSSLIIGNKNRFIYYDPKMQEVTYVPSDKIPGFFLSYKQISFGDNISVLSVLEDRNDIYIDVQDSVMKNSMMKVRLGFQKNPLIITSITVIDIAQDSDISIHLSDIKINQQVIDSVFEFKDPNFFKKIG